MSSPTPPPPGPYPGGQNPQQPSPYGGPPPGQPQQPPQAPQAPQQPYGQPPQAPQQPPQQPYGQPQQQYGSPAGYPAQQPGYRQSAGLSFVKDPFAIAAVALGVLALIASLLPYYTVSVSYQGMSQSAHANAWHGFFGWAGAILALLGGIVALATLLKVKVPFSPALVGTILFGLGFIFTLIALFVFPGDTGSIPSDLHVDKGRGVGYWLALVFTLAGTAVSVYTLLTSKKQSAAPYGQQPYGGYPPQQPGSWS